MSQWQIVQVCNFFLKLKHWTCNVIEETTLQFSNLYPSYNWSFNIKRCWKEIIDAGVCCQLCPFWRPVKEKESKRSAYLLSGKYFSLRNIFCYISQRILFSSSNHIWLILALHAWTNQLLTLKMLVFLSICQVSSTLYGIEVWTVAL